MYREIYIYAYIDGYYYAFNVLKMWMIILEYARVRMLFSRLTVWVFFLSLSLLLYVRVCVRYRHRFTYRIQEAHK